MTFLEKKVNKQERTEFTGEEEMDYFDKAILSKYNCLKGATEREKKLFLMGLYIGSEGYDYIRSRCISGAPTSYNVQEAIADSFNGAKTPSAGGYKRKIKQVLKNAG